MLDYLIELRKSYNNRFALENEYRFDEYLCEFTSKGHTLSDTKNIIYFMDNGTVHKLCSGGTKEDFTNHCRLYDMAKNTDCLIEIPLEYEAIDIDNTTYNYTVVQRPTQTLGKNFQDLIEENKITTEFILSYINEAKKLMANIYEVHKKYNVDVINPRPLMFKYRYEFDKCFWTDFKYWNRSWDKFLIHNFSDLYLCSLHFADTLNIELDIKKIMATAKKEWAF